MSNIKNKIIYIILIILIIFLTIKNNTNINLKNIKNKFTTKDFITTFKSTKNMINELKIKYAIIYGTAIGAYRNNNFIEHDDDIDIMIFHDDLKKLNHKTIVEQKDYMNYIAKKYDLVPKNNRTAPFLYKNKNKGMPILYQYVHTKTKMSVDFYIFYKYNNNLWNFCDGGEYDFKGYKYPINNHFVKIKLNIFDAIACPMEYLYKTYGPDVMTPKKKKDNNYYMQIREYFGKFPDEWLLPLN